MYKLKKDIEALENNLSRLNKNIAETRESWNDSVQRRFYKEYFDGLSAKCNAFFNDLKKIDAEFKKIEKRFNEYF